MKRVNPNTSVLIALIATFAITSCGKTTTEIALERESSEAVAKRQAVLAIEPNISEDSIVECELGEGLIKAFINDDAQYLEKNVSNLECIVNGEKPLLNTLISLGREKMFTFLINKKVKDSEYFPAAISAAQTHQLDVLKLLKANGYSLTAKDISLSSPLEQALNAKTKNITEQFDTLSKRTGIKIQTVPASPITVVKYLIDNGADPQERNRHGLTPLMIARDIEVTQYLLDQGAYINAKDDKDFTVLMNKTRRSSDENTKIFQRLLAQKPLINQVTEDDKRTALHWAAAYENKVLVSLLLQTNVDLNLKDNKDQTALMLAKETDNKDLIALFSPSVVVSSNQEKQNSAPLAKVEATNIASQTSQNKNQPITKALEKALMRQLKDSSKNNQCNNAKALTRALKKDDLAYVKANLTDFNCSIGDGMTPLLAAISYRATKSTNYLIPLTKDLPLAPAAVLAAKNLNLEVLKKLKANNFPINGYLFNGDNAAHSAVYANYKHLSRNSLNVSPTLAVLKFLNENGVSFNGINAKNKTPLMKAKELEVIVYLLEHGAEINTVDNYGKTVLYQAVFVGSYKKVEVLMWYKADPTIKIYDGTTALDIAIKNEKNYTGQSKVSANKIINLLNGTAVARKPQYNPELVVCEKTNKTGEAIKDNDINYLQTQITNYNCLLNGKLDLLNIANILHAEKSFPFLAAKVKDNDKMPLMVSVAKNLNINFMKILLANNFDINKADSQQKTALITAASKSTTTNLGITTKQKSNTPLEVVTFLIENGANINAVDINGLDALASTDSLEVFNYLIAQGAKVDKKNTQGLTALHHYDSRDWSERSPKLIKAAVINNPNIINAKDNNGNTILHRAIQRGSVKTFKLYLDLNANWLIKNNDNKTPLDIAKEAIKENRIISSTNSTALENIITDLSSRTPNTAKTLSSNTKITKVTKVTKIEVSPKQEEQVETITVKAYKPKSPSNRLSRSEFKNRVEKLKKIANANLCQDRKKIRHEIWKDNVEYIKKNVSDLSCYPHESYNLMGLAATHAAYDTLEYLAKHKVKDNPLNPSATIAASAFDLKTLKILSKYHYSMTTFNSDGLTPLLLVSKKEYEFTRKRAIERKKETSPPEEIINYLAKQGVDIDQYGQSLYIKTPAMMANTDSILAQLIKHDSDIFAIDANANTVLHSAIHRKLGDESIKMVKRLIKEEANLDAQNDKGDTPLHLAISARKYEVVKLLLNAGADQTIKNNKNLDAQSFVELKMKEIRRNKKKVEVLNNIKKMLIEQA
ncbi:ankyrin repeat domain-containing protein [Thalassotalea piscium]